MSCILKINNLYNELTDVDKKIANYINENKKIVSKLSVYELSEKVNVSTASIVRFSRKIGYEGFTELKLELAKDVILEEKEYSYIDKSKDVSVKNIVEKIAIKNSDIINQTVLLNSEEVIEKVVDLIDESKNIYIFGVGGSAIVSLDMQLKLLRINKNAFTSLDSHTQLTVSSNLTDSDLVIAISYSGNTREVIKCIENAKLNGSKCVSITKYGVSSISKLSDFNLYVPNVEKNLKEGAISSRIAMLTLIDIIYISLIQNDVCSAEKMLEESRKTIEDMNK